VKKEGVFFYRGIGYANAKRSLKHLYSFGPKNGQRTGGSGLSGDEGVEKGPSDSQEYSCAGTRS